MTVNKNSEAMSLTVTEGLSVTILPNTDHEFLMSTKEVANGYGVSYGNIREHKRVNDEFVEGKHFVSGVRFSDTEPHNKVFWTKRGIVRLGFFIKSKQARLFRDWAEDLIIRVEEQRNLLGTVTMVSSETPQLPSRRKHNRLTQERLISILADVCRIEDKELRLSLTNKLMEGGTQ